MSKHIRTINFIWALFLPLALYGQGSISGVVTDAESASALAGANVVVEGTNMGAAADASGAYRIDNVPTGTYTVTASVIGYDSGSQSVTVSDADATANFALSSAVIELSALEVMASRATRNTPVAYANITKADMELRLGSQDIPMALNTTPSVYATMQGGGAGDARINVRGFDQRNIAVMINGVPQNDMENGWVYWSNWDGVGDATSSIQMQRGLSAVNLATPSIGGTMNIITDPAGHARGGKFKQEVGTAGFKKTTFNINSGLIGDKLALSATIVRKTGDGLIDKTWTDAWAYYFGASYAMSTSNRFELYAIGAPQRHGQNLYKQNIGAYDADFAKSLSDYDKDALAENGGEFDELNGGRHFNQNWAPIDPAYEGKQYWYMYGANTVDRYNKNFLNERENFFHKPLVNFNWFWTLSDKMRLSTITYWSGGSGGGTGTYGKIPTLDSNGKVGGSSWKFYYGPSPWTRDWNTLIDYNSGTDTTVYVDKSAISRDADGGESVGILRNSINRQWTIGSIAKLNFNISESLKLEAGIDWRTAEIEHAREVRDLMGGNYYTYTGNDFDVTTASQQKKLGDIIAYHNTNTVDWLGYFAQVEFNMRPFSVYGMYGASGIEYTYTDHFFDNSASDKDKNSKNELYLESGNIGTTQLKVGGMFNLSGNMDVYANYGVIEKPPILDVLIDDNNGTVASDPKSEQFTGTEYGINFYSSGSSYGTNRMSAKINYYDMQWKDRTLTMNVVPGQGSSGDTDILFLTGLNQSHTGIEAEVSYMPSSMIRVNAAAGVGNWEYVNDAGGLYKDYDNDTTYSYNYSVKGLKVGDMPQTSYSLGVSVFPVPGMTMMAILNRYENHYSFWDPTSREFDGTEGDADRVQSWQAPSYSKVDLHITHDLSSLGQPVTLFVHVFNALDETYIQDSVDNSLYNANDKDHDADDAEVFFGLPRTVNAGLTIRF